MARKLGRWSRAKTRKKRHMATQYRHPAPTPRPVPARTETASTTRAVVLERCRRHQAQRKRRVLVQQLRRTADRAHDSHPIRRRREPLLHYRATAVRTDLLEIAAVLERVQTPDPTSIATLHKLLTDGRDSPLYNREIHISELHATLDYAGARLLRHS